MDAVFAVFAAAAEAEPADDAGIEGWAADCARGGRPPKFPRPDVLPRAACPKREHMQLKQLQGGSNLPLTCGAALHHRPHSSDKVVMTIDEQGIGCFAVHTYLKGTTIRIMSNLMPHDIHRDTQNLFESPCSALLQTQMIVLPKL